MYVCMYVWMYGCKDVRMQEPMRVYMYTSILQYLYIHTYIHKLCLFVVVVVVVVVVVMVVVVVVSSSSSGSRSSSGSSSSSSKSGGSSSSGSFSSSTNMRRSWRRVIVRYMCVYKHV